MGSLIGKRFSRLVVIERVGTTTYGKPLYKCKCDCGNEKAIESASLLRGKTKSCGCIRKEKMTIHGLLGNKKKTRLYVIWQNIKKRCLNPDNYDFKNYGGRGIIICDEWKTDFKAFHDWSMANGYSDILTIDRIDANGNYEPLNCRWVTMKEQGRNRNNNHLVEFNGEIKCVSEWAELYNTTHERIRSMLKRGYSMDEIINMIQK